MLKGYQGPAPLFSLKAGVTRRMRIVALLITIPELQVVPQTDQVRRHLIDIQASAETLCLSGDFNPDVRPDGIPIQICVEHLCEFIERRTVTTNLDGRFFWMRET